MTPEIVLGPPGTGKTTELIRLVEGELAGGTAPDRIGYVTFTRRGAEEAVERACAKFSLARDALPYFRTLHSLCFRTLGMRRGDVMEGKRLQEFAAYAGVRITGRFSEDGTWNGFDTGDRILFMENLARIRQVELRSAYDGDDDNLPWSEVLRVSKALAQFKQVNGLMDYTDMLAEFVRSEVQLNLQVLFVDEAQDLSALQWGVVRSLAGPCRRVVVAGDDDQAIYGWAGADAGHLITMEGSVRVLGQSWRVPPAIQKVANDIIAQVKLRREKVWRARDGSPGSVKHYGSFMDVDCSEGEVLVLARNTYVLKDQVEPELRRQGIVYELNGHPSIKTTTLQVIQDWEALRAGRSVPVPQAREVYKMMTAGVGYRRGHKQLPGWEDEEEVSLAQLSEQSGLLVGSIWHEALDRLPKDELAYIISARRRGEKLAQRPRVRLSTIHASKGGEADHVVVLKEMAKRTYTEMINSDMSDEARVWYVAVTRAKEQLSIVEGTTRHSCPWL